MYTLFNSSQMLRQTNTTVMAFDNVKREILNVQVGQYKRYRALNPGYLKSDHILHRVLNQIDVRFDGDLPDYYLQVSSIVNRLAGQMGFCNGSHHGRINNSSSFYGKGVKEIIIAISDDTITPADIWFNWKNLSPLRVLSHPVSGCGIFELDGSNDIKGVEPGACAVIELNIPLLACQYQLWRMATSSLSPDGFVQPVAHFLTQIVIPNMITSHLDVAILNTVHQLLGSSDYVNIPSDMPFYLADFYPRVEKALEEVVRKFSNQTHTYMDILSNIPAIGNDNLLPVVKMPDIAYTNQVVWALMIARLPVIAMLLRFDAVSNNAKNDSDRNRIKRSLREAESGKYLTNQIPTDVSQYLQDYIEKNLKQYL